MIAKGTTTDNHLVSAASKKILLVMAGTNDLLNVADLSAAAIWADCQTYCNARRAAGWTVLLMTTLPDQLAGVPADYESRRQTLLGLMQAGWSGIADAFLDFSTDAYIGVATAPTDHPTYWTNGAHLSPTGHAYLATLVKPVLESLL